jgi:hypothetical protein
VKVEITSADEPPITTVLGDDAGKAAPIVAWLPGRSKRTQIVAPIAADTVALYDRGNRITGFTLVSRRNYATPQAALEGIRNHLLEVPDHGTVNIHHESGGPDLIMENAQIDEIKVIEHIGCDVLFSYSVIGAEFNDEKKA